MTKPETVRLEAGTGPGRSGAAPLADPEARWLAQVYRPGAAILVASSLIAGESLRGILIAALVVTGVLGR